MHFFLKLIFILCLSAQYKDTIWLEGNVLALKEDLNKIYCQLAHPPPSHEFIKTFIFSAENNFRIFLSGYCLHFSCVSP